MIAVLVFILHTQVLRNDRFHLLQCIKRPKGKAYRLAGKFDKFGESSAIRQTETIQISNYN